MLPVIIAIICINPLFFAFDTGVSFDECSVSEDEADLDGMIDSNMEAVIDKESVGFCVFNCVADGTVVGTEKVGITDSIFAVGETDGEAVGSLYVGEIVGAIDGFGVGLNVVLGIKSGSPDIYKYFAVVLNFASA